jgi:DNA-binding transcriptional ArsR family regulator
MSIATRKCETCGGTGRVKLTGVYAETLACLRRHAPVSGADLSRLMGGVSPEAMCNRLAALRHHGLAEFRQHGREKLWTAVAVRAVRKGR